MTNEQLYKIVEDVPLAAWPDQLEFRPNSQLWVHDSLVCIQEMVEDAFVGAMVKYLIDRGIRPGNIPGVGKYWTYDADRNAGPVYDTLIEALAAACKATKETA